MSAPLNTLLLDTVAWDLCVDSSFNIAMAGPPYSLAQDAASAARMWLGEYWFDTTQGVPYLAIFGITPIPLTFAKTEIVEAALTVPGVSDAQVFISSIGPTNRRMVGQVQIKEGDVVVSVADVIV